MVSALLGGTRLGSGHSRYNARESRRAGTVWFYVPLCQLVTNFIPADFMKLYTRTGDDGTTGLFGGDRVSKDHPRVEAYGTIDELNAALGLAAVQIPVSGFGVRMAEICARLQSRLFDIGADLATPEASRHEAKITRIEQPHLDEIEGWIDEVDAGNEPMQQFILPGGTELSARLHLARAICRRAERRMVNLGRSGTVTDTSIIYINRVSDLLFAMARRANREAGTDDVPWESGKE